MSFCRGALRLTLRIEQNKNKIASKGRSLRQLFVIRRYFFLLNLKKNSYIFIKFLNNFCILAQYANWPSLRRPRNLDGY